MWALSNLAVVKVSNIRILLPCIRLRAKDLLTLLIGVVMHGMVHWCLVLLFPADAGSLIKWKSRLSVPSKRFDVVLLPKLVLLNHLVAVILITSRVA